MEIEIYIGYGYGSGAWETEYVDVPDDLGEDLDSIEAFISNWIDEEDKKGNIRDVVAFWGIYNIPPLIEDEDL